MSNNYGKAFERKVVQDWLKIPDADITRLYDTTNGFKSVSNVSDFIGYIYPYMFYIECKSIECNTFPFSKLRQLDKLVEKLGIKGVNPGVVIWFKKHNKVCWVPIDEIIRLQELNYKSINVKMIDNIDFKVYNIPSELRRTFMDSDYSILKSIAEQKELDK